MPVHKVAIIQARMSSSRLPGKVMQDIAGQPMLWHVVNRARHARLVDQVVIATTTDPSDDVLEQFCNQKNLHCYRGSLPDVLDRFYQAANRYRADVIIRLTADCPLLDPQLLDRTVSVFLGNEPNLDPSSDHLITTQPSLITCPYAFAANRLPPPWKRTIPIGLDVEVCSFDALQRAWKEADQSYQREHVMPYLYEGFQFAMRNNDEMQEWLVQQGNTPRGFHVAYLNHSLNYGSLRWTVDTPADLEFVRQVYAHFPGRSTFGWMEILDLVNNHPELASINAGVQHKSAFDVDQRSPSEIP